MVWALLKFVWNHPLNFGDRWRALLRVLRWQLAARLMPGPIGLPFVEDTYLFARRGMTGATGNWYCGLHELQEMAFLLHVLRSGEHFVDVGANVGSYTVLAGVVGAKVTAVEPIPSTFRQLADNVILNGLSERVQCHNIGLSASNGVLRFTANLDTVNHVLATNEEVPAIEVPVMRLDDLPALADSMNPIMIKLDVEGHELAVLQGAERVLADPVLLAVIMETNGSGARYGVKDEELFMVMARHGFQPFGYDPFKRRLLSGNAFDGNTIFVRNQDLVEQRLQTARKYRLVNGTI
jgi:FkbM family methyltransferase